MSNDIQWKVHSGEKYAMVTCVTEESAAWLEASLTMLFGQPVIEQLGFPMKSWKSHGHVAASDWATPRTYFIVNDVAQEMGFIS